MRAHFIRARLYWQLYNEDGEEKTDFNKRIEAQHLSLNGQHLRFSLH